MSTRIPEKINNYMVYKDGTVLLGIADATLPDFEALSETIKGAGLLGEFDSVSIGHFGEQEVEVNFRDATSALKAGDGTINLIFKASNQSSDKSTGKIEKRQLFISVTGVKKKLSAGKLESGAPMDSSIAISLRQIKIKDGEKEILELDKINYIYKIDGVDLLADERRALGL